MRRKVPLTADGMTPVTFIAHVLLQSLRKDSLHARDAPFLSGLVRSLMWGAGHPACHVTRSERLVLPTCAGVE
jgi:hypothetical protein